MEAPNPGWVIPSEHWQSDTALLRGPPLQVGVGQAPIPSANWQPRLPGYHAEQTGYAQSSTMPSGLFPVSEIAHLPLPSPPQSHPNLIGHQSMQLPACNPSAVLNPTVNLGLYSPNPQPPEARSVGTREPPPTKRKKKTPTSTQKAWGRHQDRIIRLYVHQGLPLHRVREILAADGFQAE